VLEGADVTRVKDAGGQLIVAPNFDADVVHAAKVAGLVALPGVMTPSEGFAALKAGADGLKLFPAEIIPPAIFKAWRAYFRLIACCSRSAVSASTISKPMRKRARRATHRFRAFQARPGGCGNRAPGARAGCGRKGLIFRPFWPILLVQGSWPLVRQLSHGGFSLLGWRKPRCA